MYEGNCKMTIREIRIIPDPVLREVSKPVIDLSGDETKTLIKDMFETMYHADGIGLAAIQIGIQQRVIVMDLADREKSSQKRHFINPEILEVSKELAVHQEGCLSIPEYMDEVERPAKCKIRYSTLDGEKKEEWTEGLYSVCIQHEIDHLNGKLFIDKLSRLKKQRAISKVKKSRNKKK